MIGMETIISALRSKDMEIFWKITIVLFVLLLTVLFFMRRNNGKQ